LSKVINLYTSNNLEYLAKQLGENLYQKKKNILSPSTVIVQSLGMQRWISLKLAQQFGVFLNCRFPFPENFAQEIFKAVTPDYELSPLYTNKSLVWLIVSLLPQCLDEKPFEPVKQYLVVDGTISQVRLYQLAHRLAYMYDEYSVYFYRDILQWEKEPSNAWQVLLWRYIKNNISTDSKICHKAQLLEHVIKALNDPKNTQVLKEKLADEVFLFGITVLPEYYITLFNVVSSIVPVHIFQLNPSKEYWFDIRSEKALLRIQQKIKAKNININDLHFEPGNPLLASLGKVGQEYIGLLLDYNAYDTITDEGQYTIRNSSMLLAHIQNDILHCIERGNGKHEKMAISPDDNSITIHSCHSPLREIEVLRDYIINILNTTAIVPNDIVVMAPDIDVYAPFIKAVFDEQVLHREGLPVLPYAIADQSYKNTSRFISAFSDVLEVFAGRLEADKVCELLDYEEITQRFGIEKHYVMAFHQWVEELNVRWGKDASHRKQYTHTESNAFTWQYAVERLLMGYAVPQAAGLVDDVIPFDSVEGSSAVVLGCFLNFLEALFRFFDEAQKPKKLEDWINFYDNLINTMLDVESHLQDYENIQQLLSSLRAIVTDINLNEDIEFLVIKSWIDDFLSEQRVSSNFLSKGITFCQLLPMRSIPFKVVCLLGMNDGEFPRLDEHISFDILRNETHKDTLPRCIRSKRNDDRYLFLESIISAQEYLFISYQGQNPKDLSLKEPSVVVSELLEYIERGFYVQDQSTSIRDVFITRHHLHHFHPAYFQEHRKYFSYSRLWFEESRALYGKKEDYKPLISQLDLPIKITDITIDELIQFFKNPARHFITKVLCIYLRDEVIELAGDELLSISDNLDNYILDNEIVTWKIDGNDIHQFTYIKKKEGIIPDGMLGDIIVKKKDAEVAYFANKVKQYCIGERQSYELAYTSEKGITITGKPVLYGGNQVFYRYANEKVRDRLQAFLWHIFVCATMELGVTTYLIVKNKVGPIVFGNISCDQAKTYLEKCIDIFIEGNKRILPFFPETSGEYYKLMNKDKGRFIQYKIEGKFYEENAYNIPDYSEPYIRRAFYKVDIFRNKEVFYEFTELAEEIFTMIQECERSQ